jgi:endonuclease/exonuclease/phosphatase (EEP) superfamily protein YafD
MLARTRRVVCALALLALFAVGLVSLLACAGRCWWLLDLASHFRVQYLWLLGLTTLSLALLEHKRWAACGVAFLSLNLYFVLPLYLGSPVPVDAKRAQLDLVVFNVHHGNEQVDEVVRYLSTQQADVLVIIEATRSLRDKLSSALPSFHRISETRADAFGMMVYSRLPLESQETLSLGQSSLPAIRFRVRKDETAFSILGIHTMPPVSAENSAIRDRMLEDAATWAHATPHAIVVGDLNATPWSHAFRDLLDQGSLVNSQRGFGVQSSWPAQLWPLSIPIDHGLHGSDLTTTRRSVGPFLGSDHRPLRLRIGVALD